MCVLILYYIYNFVILTCHSAFLLCQSFVYNIYVLNLFGTQCRYNHNYSYTIIDTINKIIVLKVQYNIYFYTKILIKRTFLSIWYCLRNTNLQNLFRAYTFLGNAYQSQGTNNMQKEEEKKQEMINTLYVENIFSNVVTPSSIKKKKKDEHFSQKKIRSCPKTLSNQHEYKEYFSKNLVYVFETRFILQ